MDNESLVLFERDGHIVTITLNRPEVRNAVNIDTLYALDRIADDLMNNSPRVVILSAAAPGFCAGVDLKESREGTPEFAHKRVSLMHGVLSKLRRMPVPIVAAIDGVALGLGCELAISADIRIASPDSLFGYPEPRVAVPSPAHHLIHLIGLARAQELLLTARFIQGEEAAAMGLATRIVSDVATEARQAAEAIAALAPLAVAETKSNIALAIRPGADEATLHHIEGVRNAATTADRKEALAAFAEKRTATFTGR